MVSWKSRGGYASENAYSGYSIKLVFDSVINLFIF